MAPKSKSEPHDPGVAPSEHEEDIRRRAYEISQSDDSGTPEENWQRAEAEIGRRDQPAT